MIKLLNILSLCLLGGFTISPALAQDGLTTSSSDPVEVTADNTLEWLRNDEKFIATGNAKAKQGLSSVSGQTLTAQYRKSPKSSMEIYRITAEKDVVLETEDSQAYGDKAVYDLDTSLATLTGSDLKLISPDQTITANEKFEYFVDEGRANALGRAKVVRPKAQGGGFDTLEADKISAIFKDNPQGERVLHSMEAIGNVVIVTPTETITSAYGIYQADTNKAKLNGSVKIRRGQNTLEGDRAEVDLTTNVSQIFGAPQTGERVRGVFYPGSEKRPDQ